MNSHSLHGNFMGDYCDGQLYKSSSLFQEDPCALQLQLAYDEAEVCNPLGSKTTVHKLGNLTLTCMAKLIKIQQVVTKCI